MINAIVFGATGMVGEGVLRVALEHPSVESVLVIGRRPCGVQHAKLREIVHANMFDYSTIENQLSGYNACFFCLGVSSLGRSAEEYFRTTYDLTMAAAQTLAKLNPQMTFCYVSGEGTDGTERGRVRWARVKGKTENDLAKLPFKAAFAFRPGFIKPIAGQQHAYGVSKLLGKFYPALHAVLGSHMCTLEELGRAMIEVCVNGYEKRVLENGDIQRVGK